MSNYIFNINNGIIIEHVKDTSTEYIESLYNSLPDNIKNKISVDDIQLKLINHTLRIASNSNDSKPDCFDVLDKWIVFGGKDFENFLSKQTYRFII